MSARKRAWINRFVCIAQYSKAPEPYTLAAAQMWLEKIEVPSAAPLSGSGWFYRDVITRAAYGKLIQLGNERHVTTPTVNANRLAAQSVPANTETVLTLSAIEWDTNLFWSPTLNPSRLTFRAPGLYLIGATIERTTGNTNRSFAVIRRGGTSTEGIWMTPPITAPCWTTGSLIAYMHEDEWIDLRVYHATTATTWKVLSFWAMAISPETLIN